MTKPDKPNGTRLRRIASDVRFWAVFFVGIVALYPAAQVIGINLPRPSWKWEFDARAAEVDRKFETRATVVDGQIRGIREGAASQIKAIRSLNRNFLRTALFQAKERKKDYEDAGKPVPPSLRQRIYNLEDQIRQAK